jgi:hypothetical protein
MNGNCKLKNENCKLQIVVQEGATTQFRAAAGSQFTICSLHFSVFILLLLATIFCAVTPARAVDTEALRRKQDAQERARDMARQLVSGILEVQLQQLEENGLKDLPVYREIAGMKKNIGALVEKEMERAVELLVKAQRGTESQREESFHQARQMIRSIVMRLSAERQNLMRRLKSAELSAQVKRLVELQTKTWQATKTLPDQPPAQQEAIALAAIEDQGDVKQLFLQLVDTLSDVSQWGGPLGAGAADGLRILQAASVGKELDSAGNLLDALRYADAAKSQQLVIKGLRLLLEKLEDTQGLLGADRQTALALARDLFEKQRKLRDETRQADLSHPDAERLVERQAEVRKDLNKLTEAIGTLPASEPLLDQAKLAAYDATGRLFDNKKEEAIAEQGKVLGNLSEIAEQLANSADASHSDKSSAEVNQQVKDLEQAGADIDRIRKQQAEVDRTAPENAAAAGRQEHEVAQALAKVDDNRQLPKSVASRLAAAEQAAATAAQSLEKGSNKAADGPQKQFLQSADRAIERAAAEIEAALNDTRRKEAGVKIGELARAAETLERAAAAERDIAQAARNAAAAEGLDAESAKKLGDRQAEVERVAQKVAEGVAKVADEAAQSARAGADQAADAHKQLDQAAAKPGEPSKSAAKDAAKSAAGAAGKLAQAAAQLRKDIDKTADGLIAESSQQLDKVSPVRAAVDEALAKAEAPVSDRIERLAKAERSVREAQAAQERAAGRPDAADAMQMENAIRDAQAEQAQADLAAQQFAEGKSSSPLESITREQSVAEQAAKLAEAAGKRPEAQKSRAAGKIDPLAESLQQAARAATRAAKSTLDGNRPQADAARTEARQALAQAAEKAAGESSAASKSQAGKPDPAAQKQVGESAANASKLAGKDVPDAGQSLAAAEKSSGEAMKQAQSGNSEQAAAAQEQTAKALKNAGEQLQQARDKLAAERKGQMAQQARDAGKLANQAAKVDPAALAALRDAQSRAENAAGDSSANSPQVSNAQSQANKDVERAAANLAARQQRIERDKAIAEAIRQMAKDQQAAAEAIADQSAQLLAAAENDESQDPNAAGTDPGLSKKADSAPNGAATAKAPKGGKRHQAAEHLAQAQRDFAQAQRGTGEAAEELSSQSQIANRPLREAMELASNLPAENVPQATGAFSKGSQKLNPSAEGAEQGSTSKKGQATGNKNANSETRPGKGGARPSPNEKADLGTGFIPNSPERTAEMMAGAEASAQAAAELGNAGGSKAAGQGEGQFPDPGDGQPADDQPQGEGEGRAEGQGKTQKPSEGKASPKSSNGGGSKRGEFKLNDDLKKGAPQLAGDPSQPADTRVPSTGPRDADAAARALGNEPWFAKLPPDLRKAIRAKAQRPPPRSYEEKLQKYFESID